MSGIPTLIPVYGQPANKPHERWLFGYWDEAYPPPAEYLQPRGIRPDTILSVGKHRYRGEEAWIVVTIP